MEIHEMWMGPAMRALTERRRRFVLAMASDPLAFGSDWAKAAGYSDSGEACKVRASENLADVKVQAAVAEVARATLGTAGPLMAVQAVLNMARNSEHPQHAKAVEMILNRTGMGEKQQIEVVHRDLTGDALMERIALLAQKHGVDVSRVIGEDKTKVIEHKERE